MTAILWTLAAIIAAIAVGAMVLLIESIRRCTPDEHGD